MPSEQASLPLNGDELHLVCDCSCPLRQVVLDLRISVHVTCGVVGSNPALLWARIRLHSACLAALRRRAAGRSIHKFASDLGGDPAGRDRRGVQCVPTRGRPRLPEPHRFGGAGAAGRPTAHRPDRCLRRRSADRRCCVTGVYRSAATAATPLQELIRVAGGRGAAPAPRPRPAGPPRLGRCRYRRAGSPPASRRGRQTPRN
jgi:hypothetical protein